MVVKYNSIFIPGMLFVLTFHGVLLYMLWQQRLIPPSEQVAKIFVNFIAAPKVEEVHKVDLPLLPEKPIIKPKPKPKPKPKLKAKPRKLVKIQQPQKTVPAEPTEPVLSDEEIITPPSPPVEIEEASVPEPKPVSAPAGPVTLATELSVTCPELSPPNYPSLSRRLGEEGKLVLRVELDKNGSVSAASVVESSNYVRLDEAALKVVKTWRCNPALRDGKPVKAIALQPFNFVLQGH